MNGVNNKIYLFLFFRYQLCVNTRYMRNAMAMTMKEVVMSM